MTSYDDREDQLCIDQRQCEALGVDKKATVMRYLYSLPDVPGTGARE